jgi:hypothetical protein
MEGSSTTGVVSTSPQGSNCELPWPNEGFCFAPTPDFTVTFEPLVASRSYRGVRQPPDAPRGPAWHPQCLPHGGCRVCKLKRAMRLAGPLFRAFGQKDPHSHFRKDRVNPAAARVVRLGPLPEKSWTEEETGRSLILHLSLSAKLSSGA